MPYIAAIFDGAVSIGPFHVSVHRRFLLFFLRHEVEASILLCIVAAPA